jgi:hypothetical protein
MPSGAVLVIGHLSDQDWLRVQGRLERALAVT